MYNIIAIINKSIVENKKCMSLPYTKMSLNFISILYNMGLINKYNISFNKIKLVFNTNNNKILFNKFKLYKKLYNRKYITYKQLKRKIFVEKKNLILNTNIGIINSDMALKYKVGGCILLELI